MEDSQGQLPKIIAVVGPTASGKTALGEVLAREFNGEIVSSDSRQIYRGMDLGTAKEKHLSVPQHLIDIVEPGKTMTVAEFQQRAYLVIEEIRTRGKLPVLVGGSMLHLDAISQGYLFKGPGSHEHVPRYETLKIGISWDRETLKERARVRLHERVEAGLPQEVASLLDAGVDPNWLKSCGLEYRHYTEFCLGECTEAEAFERTVAATNGYIKRQLTWWRHHGPVIWVKSTGEATEAVRHFLG